MRFRIELPGAIYRQARDRAGDDVALAAVLIAYVTAYATGQTAQQRGGQTAAARLSPTERSDRARHAAIARHHPTNPSP